MSSHSEPVNLSSHPHPLHLTNIHNNGLRHDCNACLQQISGFSYRCGPCEFDLHITCASMPFSLTHQSHHHQLFLIFSPPYHNKHFTCDICGSVGYNHWLYRCESCGFDAHLGCIHTPNIQQTHMQSYQSTPTANPRYQAPVGTLQFPTGPTPRPWPSHSEPVNHSIHPHPLYLTNIYYSGLRHDCNACGQQISGFSYRCERCNFDLHITCASMPLSLIHHSHHHQLFLIFSPPYHNKHFTCDICGSVGYNHWLYRCESCGFDAHLGCIHTPTIQQTHMQSYQSTPTANPRYQAPVGTLQFPTGPTPWTSPPLIYLAGPPNNYAYHGHGPHGIVSLVNQVIQGLINAITQTSVMYVFQALLGVGAFAGTTNNSGGGSNAYGGNGGGGGDWGGDGGPSNYYGGNGCGSGDWGGDGGTFF